MKYLAKRTISYFPRFLGKLLHFSHIVPPIDLWQYKRDITIDIICSETLKIIHSLYIALINFIAPQKKFNKVKLQIFIAGNVLNLKFSHDFMFILYLISHGLTLSNILG
jgi:hypothetical protein